VTHCPRHRAACQALDGEELELQAVDGVDPLRDDYTDDSNLAELEGRLRGNEFFRDCLATRTVTLKVPLSLARLEVAVLISMLAYQFILTC
jgi:hypothetical protein